MAGSIQGRVPEKNCYHLNEGAGQEDSDAIERYFPEEVKDAVSHYIEKYDLDDVTQLWG